MKILLISFFLFFSNSAFSQEKFFLTDSVSVTPKVINISQNNNQCNYIENYIDILNCDLSAIVKQCTQDNGINPRKWQNINFTRQPNNFFMVYPLSDCKKTFLNIFGMIPHVFATWNWDPSKHEDRFDREMEIEEQKEKVNMVLISLNNHSNDKIGELFNYLVTNKKKSRGNLNTQSEVNSGMKNFVLRSFDAGQILLICKRNDVDRCSYYLAYVRSELVLETLNLFIETDKSKSQL